MAAPSEQASPPRVAVLGCGGWGANHVRTMHGLGALAVACDPAPAARQWVTESFPDVEVVADAGEVFARDDIAGVVLATPAVTHAELAIAAMASGKDVLVEKPLATDLDAGRRVVAAAADTGRILMVGHVLEYHPAVRRLHELVTSGALGAVRYGYSNRVNLGRIRTEENVLWSFAPHDISMLLRLVGRAPESVACRGGAWVRDGIDDTAVVTMGFGGGVEAHVLVSWLHPFKEHRLVLVGEQQMAVFDDTAPADQKLVLYAHEVHSGGAAPTVERADGKAEVIDDEPPLTAECRHFVDRIVDRAQPLTDGASALAVLGVLDAATRSLRQGGAPMPIGQPTPASEPSDRLGDGAAGSWWAHPTATVDAGATLGPGTKVWHYAHVMGGAVIGADCSLGQNVFVADRVRIGDRVRIQNNVSVYEGVELDDGVFCGPSMVFTNVFNPRAEVERKDEYRPTLVQRGASLGANCTIVCGVTIGEYAFVGAGAVVRSDVAPYAVVAGVPARPIGWMCRCGETLSPPADGSVTCARCGSVFELDGARLCRVGP